MQRNVARISKGGAYNGSKVLVDFAVDAEVVQEGNEKGRRGFGAGGNEEGHVEKKLGGVEGLAGIFVTLDVVYDVFVRGRLVGETFQMLADHPLQVIQGDLRSKVFLRVFMKEICRHFIASFGMRLSAMRLSHVPTPVTLRTAISSVEAMRTLVVAWAHSVATPSSRQWNDSPKQRSPIMSKVVYDTTSSQHLLPS